MNESDNKKVTIEDVAIDAKVSIATVSRVINGFSGVSSDVIERVNKSINDLNYIKNSRIRTFDKKNTYIGVVIPNISNPYSSDLVKMVQDTLDNFGYNVIIMDSGNNDEKSVDSVYKLLNLGIKGLIYLPTHHENNFEKKLLKLSIPTVFLGRKIGKNTNFVGCETSIGIYNGTKYLLSLGHINIAYITGDKKSEVDIDGLNGFLKAYNENDLMFDYDNLLYGDYNMDFTESIVKKMLLEKKVTAIMCSGDIMAYGALKAAKNLGISVPKDLSIMGFDDLPISSVLDLTTIAQNSFSIGQSAALLLDDLLEGRKTTPQEILLPTNIVIRSTCGLCNN
ncbi:MAG: LacI family DNA-binding transcriptional regulator [Spirochaetales bacterium]|nr:LacI family DNA-binding transcriptional regulator [Spirochaetales bacterium]